MAINSEIISVCKLFNNLKKLICVNFRNRGFEIERAIEASKLFMGRHDFRSFMGGSKEERTVCNGNTWHRFKY